MLIGTPYGKAYSQGELFQLARDAGFMGVNRLPIQLPNGAGILSVTR